MQTNRIFRKPLPELLHNSRAAEIKKNRFGWGNISQYEQAKAFSTSHIAGFGTPLPHDGLQWPQAWVVCLWSEDNSRASGLRAIYLQMPQIRDKAQERPSAFQKQNARLDKLD